MRALILRSIILIILIIISEKNISFCQWIIQQSNTTEDLRDVYFTDAKHGWAVGGNETIIATMDGGENWIVQRTLAIVDSLSRGATLSRVKFVNNEVGYAVGEGGTILATKDGGSTWTKQESGISYIIKGVSFISPDKGWVSGSDYIYGEKSIAILLHTTDGGSTWERFYEVPISAPFLPNFFNDVIFTDRFNGWAFETYYMDNFNSTYVHKTIDGGKNWEKVGETSGPINRVEMASIDSIWASGIASVYISFDGGVKWNILGGYIAFGGVKDVEPINGKCAYFVANTGTYTRICLTEDGGDSYNIILENITLEKQNPYIWALSAVGKELLWAVGDSGLVMKHEGIISSIEENVDLRSPEDFSLSQNYPNPFNSTTVIPFSVAKESKIKIIVYNVKGEEIIILEDSYYMPGSYKVYWDGKDKCNRLVSTGIYFYKLLLDNNDYICKKMIYIK